GLRFTVKRLGDESAKMQHIRPGTRVFAEGPYGRFTPQLQTRRKVLLIAGGIGITPLRAMLDAMRGDPGDVVLLYRTVTPRDAVFAEELDALARRRGVTVHILPGEQIGTDQTDMLGIPALRRGVPDIAARDCFVCGPPAFIEVLRGRLRKLGVPRARIHF